MSPLGKTSLFLHHNLWKKEIKSNTSQAQTDTPRGIRKIVVKYHSNTFRGTHFLTIFSLLTKIQHLQILLKVVIT